MIEITSNRKVAFLFNAIKVTFYFALIFYAAKLIYNYILKYLIFMMTNNLTAELSPLVFLLGIIDNLLEHFMYDLIIVLAFTFVYSLRNKYVFRGGFLYAYKGFLYVKERTISYDEIREIDYNKTVFDTGNIIIRLHEEKKPIIIPYVSKVMERFEEVKKEIRYIEKNEEYIHKQVQRVGPKGRA